MAPPRSHVAAVASSSAAPGSKQQQQQQQQQRGAKPGAGKLAGATTTSPPAAAAPPAAAGGSGVRPRLGRASATQPPSSSSATHSQQPAAQLSAPPLQQQHAGEVEQVQPEQPEPLAPIQLLPDLILQTILSFVGPYNLARAACVCKQWQHLADHPAHWRAICRDAFGPCHKTVRACSQLVARSFGGSWRQLFLETPHVRFEGLYVSRNTYIRQGVAEWKREKTCHLVTYYRYFRLFPDGSLLYRTSPLVLKVVAKTLARHPHQVHARASKHEQHVHTGRYVIRGCRLYMLVVYPNSRATELRLRATIRGVPLLASANRLDLDQIVTFDRDSGTGQSLLASPDEEPAGAGSVKSFGRGLQPCVFVPWEAIASHALNAPAKDMDFWLVD